MTQDDFVQIVSKLFTAAKTNLRRDKSLRLTLYIDCLKEPIYFQPKFKKKTDLSNIRNRALHLLKDNEARFYAIISLASDIESKETMILVQGFHKDGRFINFSIPFSENNGKIQFGKAQKSTSLKTANGFFSHMFLHLDTEKRFLLPVSFGKRFGIDLNYQFVTIEMKGGAVHKHVGIHGGEISSAQVGDDFRVEDIKTIKPVIVDPVKNKSQFRVVKDLPITGLTTWAAPYTGDFECVLPKGTILISDCDPVPGAIAFSAIPERYEELEISLVPEKIRTKLKYNGYYFSLKNALIGHYLKYVTKGSRRSNGNI